jgi:hypothetical protein
MKVKAKYNDCKTIKNIEQYGCFRESVLHITKNNDYEVYAIIVYKGIPMLQIINDANKPDWLASVFFEAYNHSIPNDWICNIVTDNEDQEILIMGPNFIAKDALSYDRMIDLEPEEVHLFWERIKQLENHE